MAGEIRKPLVIGKAVKPRCFGKFIPKQLPVDYYANPRAWMTSAIYEEWLTKFDKEMARENRQLLKFADNAPCHKDIQRKLNNITLKYLPPNTTSVTQPLDGGIIQTMKLKF
jgi:hypothetical protein